MNTVAQIEQVITGYQIIEQLYTGSRTLVYRAIRICDQQPVILKTLRNGYPSFNELIQFRNQYTIAKNLDLPGIIQTYSLEPCGNGYVLVMEDFGGMSLAQFAEEKPLDITTFLAIAIQLAEILHGLYQHRVIHKDIKPANILIHPETKQVKLIDFSISSLLPRETQEIQNPNILEGTLAYISPEQTGRMNRGIDYRTDFYSLGVTFYELLTGQLPFSSDDPIELVHCHLAMIAPPIDQNYSNIPLVLSQIIAKLMAKNAEDRYQSALGLKQDLQRCLTEWKETGTITEFEIAQQDRSDRFVIPEKLYGREAEVKTLLDAFDRVAIPPQSPQSIKSEASSGFPLPPFSSGDSGGISSGGRSEMMLVAGFSGIGKTAVINEVHKPIVRQRGYFIKGKFDQFNRNIPFSAFVQAFRDLMRQLLGESDSNIAIWKTKILNALGENGQVIMDVIPELEHIIGQQPAVPELSGSAAQNRFNLLLSQFVRVFTTKDHPLVIFLDDLQWADSASLKLLKLLMSESKTGYLLVLGAYRDNEVFPAHPLMLTLDEIKKQDATINTLTLTTLDEADITRLVADTLLCECEVEIAAPLSRLVYQKTKGNPFFTTQFLKGLYEENYIQFIPSTPLKKGGLRGNFSLSQTRIQGGWQCNLTQIRQLALTDNVVEFMVGRLRKLPKATQNVLKLAACIGNRFDVETLAVVCEETQEGVATDLWRALQEGFVIPENETYKFFQGEQPAEKNIEDISVHYRFLHDRVQQAAYTLIPEDEKQKTHLKIGRLLWKNTPQEQIEFRIFDIVSQLNMSLSLLVNPEEKQDIIRLNLKAGQKAKIASAYHSSLTFFKTGIHLLEVDTWQTDYDLALTLHEEGANIAYLCGEYKQSEQWINLIFKKANHLLDKINGFETQILSLIAQNQLNLAIDTGLNVLSLLEIKLLESAPTDFNIADLYHLPEIKDPRMLAALKTLIKITAPAYNATPQLIPSIAATMVDLCRRYGNSALAAYAYAFYGMILCSSLDNIPLGYQLGRLALQVLERFQDPSIKGEVYHLFNVGIRHWQEPALSTLEAWKQTIQLNRESGNVGYVCYAAMGYGINLVLTGKSLDFVVKESKTYLEVIKKEKQNFPFYGTVVWIQFGEILSRSKPQTLNVTGEFFDEVEQIPKLKESQNLQTLFSTYLIKGILCYLFRDYQSAVHHLNLAQDYQQTMAGLLAITQYPFYQALALLAIYPRKTAAEQQQIMNTVEHCLKQLAKWAKNAPMNYQHKYDLVSAEKHRVLGEILKAIELYDQAISGAKANEYIQEEALANERAAQFYLDWGKEKMAAGYLQEAYYCYARWGAKAKTNQLEQTYPQLLALILRKAEPLLNSSHSLTSSQPLGTVTTATSTLDLASALKASRAISGEIELDVLLSKLMHIVLENAGADKASLILNHSGTWEIVARCDYHNCSFSTTPLEQTNSLPLSIINTVKRTQQTLLINDFQPNHRFATDPYFVQQQPKSLFCTPILNQGQLIGILYLENYLTAGAFTADRIEILNLLTAQAAISIENARLYHRLEDYSHSLEVQVEHRTQQLQENNQHLQQTLEELQHTQAQLIQAEKMSGLGQMVAGIAHEINNPISFITGNISYAREYFQDLLELLDLYEQNLPHPNPVIQEKREEIDLEFLQKDLENLFNSMKTGSDRIRQIILGLRNFSRLDESESKLVDIHEGLENTLLIVQHRLKPQGKHPEIAIVKNYGELPPINCYASQLNQVFLHLLTNAIDALTAFEGKHNPKIHITTEMKDSQTVKIVIADNGSGMSENIRQRIFDPFFTTKPVGKGTGLGLSISYQIITEQHGGQLQCISQPGQGTEFTINLPISK